MSERNRDVDTEREGMGSGETGGRTVTMKEVHDFRPVTGADDGRVFKTRVPRSDGGHVLCLSSTVIIGTTDHRKQVTRTERRRATPGGTRPITWPNTAVTNLHPKNEKN